MAETYQLDLFKSPEICRLEAEIKEVKKGSDRVRKGVFARLNRLQKMYDEINADHEVFKRAICKGYYDGK